VSKGIITHICEDEETKMPEIKDKKDKVSARERGALKRQQDEIKKAAVRQKSRQLNTVFRVVAVLGIVLAGIALFQDFYPHRQFSRSGIDTVKDVVMTGQAYVYTRSAIEPFALKKTTPIQLVLGIFPFVLAGFLLMYIVDFVAPLGVSLQLFAMGFTSAMITLLMLMSGSAGVMKQGFWPGLQGPPVVAEMAALFVFFLGALTSVPGATRRLNEYLGIAEPAAAPKAAVAVAAAPAIASETVEKTAPEKTSDASDAANAETPATGTPIVESSDTSEEKEAEKKQDDEKETKGPGGVQGEAG
jgi:hypothetical protein